MNELLTLLVFFKYFQKPNTKSSTNHEDILNIDHDEGTDADPFGQKLFSFQQDGDVYEAVVVGRSGQYLAKLVIKSPF